MIFCFVFFYNVEDYKEYIQTLNYKNVQQDEIYKEVNFAEIVDRLFIEVIVLK